MKNSESGQGLVEYALILILVAVMVLCVLCAIAIPLLGGIALAGDWLISNWEMIKSGNPMYLAGACLVSTVVLVLLGLLLVIFGRRRRQSHRR